MVQRHTLNKIDALKEATTNVLLGTLINFPLGFIVLWLAQALDIIVTDTEQRIQLVIFQSIIFSIVAIIRGTYVRLYFAKKQLTKVAQ